MFLTFDILIFSYKIVKIYFSLPGFLHTTLDSLENTVTIFITS